MTLPAEEWRTISEKLLPEWNTRLDRICFLADCYRDACNDMTALYNMLCETRRSNQTIGREHGSNEEIIRYNQIFTRGLSSKDVQFLTREDTDTISNVLFLQVAGNYYNFAISAGYWKINTRKNQGRKMAAGKHLLP